METLIATVASKFNIEAYANVINNGRTDSVYFYVNGNNVSVSSPYCKLTKEIQLEELNWFLKGKIYVIN